MEKADTLLVWHWGRVIPGDGGLGGVVWGKRRCKRVRTERCAYLARHVVLTDMHEMTCNAFTYTHFTCLHPGNVPTYTMHGFTCKASRRLHT